MKMVHVLEFFKVFKPFTVYTDVMRLCEGET